MPLETPAIDYLVETSLESENEDLRLKWLPYYFEKISGIKSTQIDNVYYSVSDVLVCLGSSQDCTPTLVSEFSRVYSLPTHKHNNVTSQFRRYYKWLEKRNRLIKGFAKSNDNNNYYMVAYKPFYHCYSRYGFCSTCGILRCSPVWCICGHKQLSNGWTSNNKQLDDLIKKSQLQTNSPDDAYLEWIPHDSFKHRHVYGLPVCERVRLTPLELTDETDDSYYAVLCDEHPDILTTGVWVTIGFTYNEYERQYCLVEDFHGRELCLACTCPLIPKINLFCFHCKAPRPVDWTTGDKSLDSLIMESWSNTRNKNDAYIQWVEYTRLTSMQEMTSLRHGCTYIADWLDLTTNEVTRVSLKKIVEKWDDQLFDFHQLTKQYPELLTPENVWILGITREPPTREPSTRKYYLVFYYDVRALLYRFLRNNQHIKYIRYGDFYGFKEIGSGRYGTVYAATYNGRTVALKRFTSFALMPELFISEFRNYVKCLNYSFLKIYGVAQDPETKEYMIVMQYANNGSLLSYLNQNINNLTWMDKLLCLQDIAWHLRNIHDIGLVHCDLHGENIVLHNYTHETKTYICGLGLSRSVNSRESSPNIQGILPFVAPEVFHTRKFTQRSDVYSFGIIMYLIATGEPPFRDRTFDEYLARDIRNGLRPLMPDSAPEEYKKLAERCCDADPDKRPENGKALCEDVRNLQATIYAMPFLEPFSRITSRESE